MKSQAKFLIFLCFIGLVFSCKKNMDLDDSLLLGSLEFISPFYATGTIVDLENDTTFITSIEKINTDETTNTLNPNITYSSSDVGIQSTTDTKFVLSYTGLSREKYVGDLLNDEPILTFLNNGIAVKVASDLPSDLTPFSREELLKLLANGSVLKFGSDPGEVEISMHHVKTFENLGTLTYSGSSANVNDLNEHTFEILNIEEYIQENIQNPINALLVTANINCSLTKSYTNDSTVSDFNLVDFEAVFFFEYE